LLQLILINVDFAEEQRIALKNAIGTPEHRSTMNLNDYIYYSLAGVNTPQMLSLLQNRGESQDVILQNLVLSSIGKSFCNLFESMQGKHNRKL